MSESEIAVRPHEGGHFVEVYHPFGHLTLTAQEAYELSEALSAVLPHLVQPFYNKK